MKTCAKCRREMTDGSLAYEVRIEVAADFDGVLPSEQEGSGPRRALLAALELVEPDAAMESVYHEERHLLCPRCRDRFLANPLNLPLPETLLEPPPGGAKS
jgi:hypothetical protein